MLVEKKNITKKIEKAFRLGYVKAVTALSQLLREKIQVHEGINLLAHQKTLSHHLETLYIPARAVLTTELFGDMAGKSFWILNEESYQVMMQKVKAHQSQIHIQKEFVKELDNIISAAVISCLADQLNLNVYGDIPQLSEDSGEILPDHIVQNFGSWGTAEFYVSAVWLSVENTPKAKSLFLWVLDATRLKGENQTDHD